MNITRKSILLIGGNLKILLQKLTEDGLAETEDSIPAMEKGLLKKATLKGIKTENAILALIHTRITVKVAKNETFPPLLTILVTRNFTSQ